MFRKFSLIPILFLFALATQAQTKTLKYNTRVNDNINGYFEYLPINYNDVPAKEFPLFIYLHGTGTAGDGSPGVLEYVVNSGWGTPPWRAWRDYLPTSFTVDPDGQQREFVLITPQFRVEPYQSHTEVRDVEDLINYCISNYNIDTTRIYLAGQSGGGAYVMEYVSASLRNANRIAAVLGSSEAIFATQDEANILAEANLPLWLVASQYDLYDPNDLTLLQRMASSWITAINNAPNASNPTFISPKLTILPGKHTHNDAAVYLYDPATTEDEKNAYEWMLQYDRKLSPVPVTGLQLTAQAGTQSITLHWQTQTEENNKGFSVERSADGTHFQSLAFVPSKSANGLGSSYSYVDQAPLSSINYYRLNQTDKDGRSTYSEIVTESVNSAAAIKIFPNPVHNLLTIQLATPIQNARLQIFDAQGKLCLETLLSGTRKIEVNVNHLSKGVYNARISNKDKPFNFTFVKN